MSTDAIRNHFNLDGDRLIDRWLRFAPIVQARYDVEHAAERTAEVRTAVLVGLALYNVYNVTSIVFLSDILLLSVALRAGLVTPVSLALTWVVGQTSSRWTERLILVAIFNAYLVPVFLFWFTHDPLGLFTFGEFSLTIVFANMLLALRFQHAVIFNIGAMLVTLSALLMKDDLSAAIRFGFTVQIATACMFGLYANYRIERRRCSDYLAGLGATLQAGNADTARIKFQNLSRTDALTGLPNRRHLTERLDEWFATPDAIALMMIDIDHFKLFNDALGHPAGDDCLRRIGEVFAAVVMEDNAFCARFGGEEFTLVLKGPSELESARRARNLVQAIEALNIPHPARSDGIATVTISIGFAMRAHGMAASPATLMAAADRALYSAKKQGRNRFVLDDDELGDLVVAG